MNEKFKLNAFLLLFLKKHKSLCIGLLLSILLSALIGLLPPMMLRSLIDDYISKYISSDEIVIGKLVMYSVLYFLSYFLVGLFTVLENFLVDLFGQKMIHELRYEMMKKMQRLKASYFTHHGTGEIQSQLMDDVYSIESLFATGIVSILVSFIKIIGILISVFTFSWLLGVIVLVLIPVIYFITRIFSKSMRKINLINRKEINAQSNDISESVDNFLTIQNLDEENYREQGYEKLLLSSYKVRNKAAIFDAIYSPIIELLKAILIALITILVFYSSIQNNVNIAFGITVGTFAASLTLISNLFSPIQTIGQEMQTMQEGLSGVDKVEMFMNLDENNQKDNKITFDEIFSTKNEYIFEFDNLTFKYEDGNSFIFDNLSLKIKNNEKVTLVGRTGAGKTTLMKLILGIEIPTSGCIRLNGYDVSLIPDKEKRKIFGYVEQGFQSIPGTILEQVTLGDESYSLDEVRSVMKKVGLDDYVIDNMKEGYQEKFSDSLFSRGQLQLLSLARALLSDPKVLLLDEISANLDSKTERDVIEAISNSTKNRTVISISHRLSDQLGFDRTIEIK